jgi:hypothetical protein
LSQLLSPGLSMLMTRLLVVWLSVFSHQLNRLCLFNGIPSPMSPPSAVAFDERKFARQPSHAARTYNEAEQNAASAGSVLQWCLRLALVKPLFP